MTMTPIGSMSVRVSTRRPWIRTMAFALAAASAVPALSWAQSSYPDKPIRVIVPFPAGTSPDIIARAWSDKLRLALGQPVLVDNRPGAATIIGAQAVLAAPADGYTLLYTAQNTVAINPFVYKNLPYKADDFVPVSHITTVPLVLITAANSPIKSFADLIEAAKASPGKLNYASYGVGQGTHMVMVRMLNATGVTMTHIPYQNGGVVDIMSGAVNVSFDASTTTIPLIKGGKLRALAVSSAKRLDLLPDVPAITEMLPGFNGDSWQGMLVRAGTAPNIIAKLAAESQKIIDSEDFRKKLRDYGLVPAGGTPAEFSKFIGDDSRASAKVVKDNDIRID